MLSKIFSKLSKKLSPAPKKATLSTHLKSHGIIIKGIIHVGANEAQEMTEYQRLGANNVVWIEPIPELVAVIKSKIEFFGLSNHMVLQACCSGTNNQDVIFNVASNNGESSSMLELGAHQNLHPEISYVYNFETTTVRLDSLNINFSDYNVLVIDTQGADLLVLNGASNVIHKFDAVYIEVSDFPVYTGGATLNDIYNYLYTNNFFLHYLSIKNLGYGNAFFVNRRNLNKGYLNAN